VTHTDRREDNELIRAAPVDLVLSGDDHDLRVDYDGEMALVESGSQAEFVAVISVTMDTVEGSSGPSFVWEPAFELINTASVEPNARLAEAVQGYADKLSTELDIEIGTTEVPLDSRRTTVRAQETALANLIADAIREAVGADVALTNGGGIRADRTYEPGTVLTRRDIQSELPFGNKTILIEVSGAELREALEHGVSAVEDGGGRFPQVAGLTFVWDASKEPGSRIVSVEVMEDGAWAEIDRAKTYGVVSNNFVRNGGDGYAMFVDAMNVYDFGPDLADVTAEYMAKTGPYQPYTDGRIAKTE
jgi:2',3'-cyclic-nucleotide 2'-phosphodiesterase (5'-nucleotidase family)